jgi:hypothetical protein
MKIRTQKAIGLLFSLLLTLLATPCKATLTFDSMNAYLSLQQGQAQLQLTNVQNVLGWGQQSIIRSSGPTTPDTWAEQYSNGVVIGQQQGTPSMHLIYANSDAILGLTGNVATAMIGVNNNSNAILTLASGVNNNSNAILTLASGVESNSNALLYGDRVNSNAIVSGGGGDGPLSRANSSAIVRLDTQAETIFGPNAITITTPTYDMTTDIYLSGDHMMNVQPAGGTCVINGNGHTISFAKNASYVINVADNTTLTFQNIVIKNYTDAVNFMESGTSSIYLGNNSTVYFGDGTTLELGGFNAESTPYTEGTSFDFIAIIADPMVFSGNTIMRGNFANITLFPFNTITVNPHSTLTVEDMTMAVGGTVISCADTTSNLWFSNSKLMLEDDYSFTSGNLLTFNNVEIEGSSNFFYQSAEPLSIVGKLTLSGITLQYNPPTDNRGLIQLNDDFFEQSSLCLNGCTLSSTTTGMQLIGGQLIVTGKNYLSNSATSLSEGFCFGDGYSNDDLAIIINPGGSLNATAGTIVDYENVN